MGTLDTVLIIGGLAAAGWCFFMGPCQEWISGLTGDGNSLQGFQPKSARGQQLFSDQNFVNDFINTSKQVTGKSEAESKRIVEQNLSKYKANYASRSYLSRYQDTISV